MDRRRGAGRSRPHRRAPVGFQRFGVVPDFVTLGKPMGNGYPVAAVIRGARSPSRSADVTLLQHLRRQPGRARRRAGRARRDRRRARARARRAHRGALLAPARRLADRHPGSATSAASAWLGRRVVADPATRPTSARRGPRRACASRGVLIGTTGRHGTCSRSARRSCSTSRTCRCWSTRSTALCDRSSRVPTCV